MDEVEDQGESREVLLDAVLQRLGAVGQGHPVLDVGAFAARACALRLERGIFAGRSPTAACVAVQRAPGPRAVRPAPDERTGNNLRRCAYLGGNGVESRDHGFFLAAVLLAFAQAHLRLARRGPHHRHAFAIGLDDQEGGCAGRGRRWLLRIEGFNIARILGHHTDRLGGEFQA